MIPFPKKKYNVIYAAPPWHYQTWGEGSNRNVTSKYDTMSPEEIFKLPVSDLADEDCVLFIWVTFPKLLEGIKTIEEWGFTYKTLAFNWVKTNKKLKTNQTSFLPMDSFDTFWGLGYWTRANSELCLLATRGKPKRESCKVHQLVYEPVREHSRKPDCVRDRIVELIGDVPRIELFARQKANGWDNWGNEL